MQAQGAAGLELKAKEIELQVAVASVHTAGGKGGGGGRARDWYNQKVRQLLFNLRCVIIFLVSRA